MDWLFCLTDLSMRQSEKVLEKKDGFRFGDLPFLNYAFRKYVQYIWGAIILLHLKSLLIVNHIHINV